MNILHRSSTTEGAIFRSRLGPAAVATSLVLFGISVGALMSLVDGRLLSLGVAEALDDLIGLGLIAVALLSAFSVRAWAWQRLLPELRFGQALAAVHVALGGNHVLPFRLGEPLRIVSVVRRAGVAAGPATSTTVVLRSADVLALLALGLVASPRFIWSTMGVWGLAATLTVGAVGASSLTYLARQRRLREGVRLPGPFTVGSVFLAWLLEAFVVWRVVGWFGIELSATDTVVVLATAVTVQLLAITPGGIGTYEAAATAALVATSVPVTTALTAAVILHGCKTIYSIVAGGIAVVLPTPGLLGRFRLELPARTVPAVPAGTGPVVLFMPARNEAPRIGGVIGAAPAQIAGRRVEVVVIDDGSTDDTILRARRAGATVVEHGINRGLGAAVRTGLAYATERGASAVAFCDADGEYDPAELETLVRPILLGQAHHVVGSRFSGRIDHMRPHRRFGNQVLTRALRYATRQPITDGQSGYRAFSTPAAAQARVAHDYNYAQVLTIDLVSKGFGYHEVPITYHFRTSGRSFVRLGTYLRQVVPTVWRMLNPYPQLHVSHSKENNPSCDINPGPVRSPLPLR